MYLFSQVVIRSVEYNNVKYSLAIVIFILSRTNIMVAAKKIDRGWCRVSLYIKKCNHIVRQYGFKMPFTQLFLLRSPRSKAFNSV